MAVLENREPVNSQTKIEQSSFGDLYRRYVPQYLLEPPIEGTFWSRLIFKLGYIFLKPFANIVLRPRPGLVGDLDQKEVEKVYWREAKTYNRKHHLTTRGMDLCWRNWVAQSVCTYALAHSDRKIRVMDLCTGTGLTIKSIISAVKHWELALDILGVDYNEKMLEQARSEIGSDPRVSLKRGNASKLVEHSDPDFAVLRENSFDVVSQMFGIGGVADPLQNIAEVLKVLRVGGMYLLVDMHCPIKPFSGEFFYFGRFFRAPYFEQEAYKKLTIPIVLNRLWGWRDTTKLFYLAPLITCKSNTGVYYGFRREHFEFESLRWFFSLPVMPVAKVKLQKVQISVEEARQRKTLLQTLMNAASWVNLDKRIKDAMA